MNQKPVLSKEDFVLRYEKGEFGNQAPTWNTIQEFLESDYFGLVHIRNRVKGGPTWYNIDVREIYRVWNKILNTGIKPQELYISGMASHERGTIQGEVCQSSNFLDLTYCSARLPMRIALQEKATYVNGLEAVGLLKKHMNANSYGWFCDLLETYPEHVVEFSCFEVNWGTIPGHNTVFWECRKY